MEGIGVCSSVSHGKELVKESGVSKRQGVSGAAADVNSSVAMCEVGWELMKLSTEQVCHCGGGHKESNSGRIRVAGTGFT